MNGPKQTGERFIFKKEIVIEFAIDQPIRPQPDPIGPAVCQSKYDPPRNHLVQTVAATIVEEFPAGIWGVPFREIFNRACENHVKRGIRKPSESTVRRAKKTLKKGGHEF